MSEVNLRPRESLVKDRIVTGALGGTAVGATLLSVLAGASAGVALPLTGAVIGGLAGAVIVPVLAGLLIGDRSAGINEASD